MTELQTTINHTKLAVDTSGSEVLSLFALSDEDFSSVTSSNDTKNNSDAVSSSSSSPFQLGEEWKRRFPQLTFPEIEGEMNKWAVAVALIVVIILLVLFMVVLWMAF